MIKCENDNYNLKGADEEIKQELNVLIGFALLAEYLTINDLKDFIKAKTKGETYDGIEILEKIRDGKIKNSKIRVYKNDDYKFTIECGEKGILTNSQFHVGMLTSDKYSFEPIKERKMTLKDIEKELGYPVKIVS